MMPPIAPLPTPSPQSPYPSPPSSHTPIEDPHTSEAFSPLPPALSLALSFLDGIRRAFWRWFVRLRLGGMLIADRSARVVAYAIFGMSVALLCTLFVPLWLLLIGPLLLGTPHIVSDIRYLLIRPPKKVERWAVWGILLPLALMTALRIGMMGGLLFWPAAEIACGSAAILGAVATSRADLRLRMGLLVFLAVCSMWLIGRPWQTILALGHLHNLVAVGIWLWWSRGDGPWPRYAGVVVFYLGAIGLLASGWLEPLAASMGAYRDLSNGFDLNSMVRLLAPGVEPVWGLRIVLIYTFAQSVHYSIWLRLVPNNHHFYARKGPSTFRRNIESLHEDFGSFGLWLVILGCLAVPFIGLFQAVHTRNAYLTLIAFHGWLELAFIAHVLCNAARSSDPPPVASLPTPLKPA